MSHAMGKRRRPRAGGERGNVSLLVVVMMPALLMAAGLVLDGGRQVDARRDARGDAQSAARAAVQMTAQEVTARHLDSGLATARGNAELSARGASGTVSVNGAEVTVTVTRNVDYLLLPGGRSVTETATANAVRGVNEGGS